MQINFLQGIISGSINPPFLSMNGTAININAATVPLLMTLTSGTHNYLYIETSNINAAWTVSLNSTCWLYIDINPATGTRTFGETPISPINQFGAVLPTSPVLDQHFFDYNDKIMKVWNGFLWEPTIRVFLGKYSNNVITPNGFTSQVNLSGVYTAGYMLYNSNNNPLFSNGANNSEKYFITTEEEIHSQDDLLNGYKLSSLVISAQASEPIPIHSCITWKGQKQLGIASNVIPDSPCIGISANNAANGGMCQYIIRGFITDTLSWNFTAPPTSPIFVGVQGEITTSVPQVNSIQPIGYIVDSTTIFIDIKDIILIENTLITPTPIPII